MIDLKTLQKALAVIGNLGKGELTVEVDGTPVVLRVLTADEDIDAQRYSRMNPDGDGEPEGLVLLERYKRFLLSHAIVQVGSLDLRGVEFVATGDVTDQGVPVRESRPVAVRKILDTWSRVATMALFQKYLELQRRVDAEAEKAIYFDLTDVEAEIVRVERRLENLKKEQKHALAVQQDKGMASAVAAVESRLRNPAPAAPPEETPAAPPEAAPATSSEPVRQRVLPRVAAPPPRPMQPPPVATPPDASDELPDITDSLGDGPAQIAAETARLVAARQAARRRSQEVAVEPPPIQAPIGRAPPHRAAMNTANAVLDTQAGSIRAARPAVVPEGGDVHRLEPVMLSHHAELPNPKARIRVNEELGTDNPRFKKR